MDNDSKTSSIIIGKHTYETKDMELRQSDLSFYPDNPRVYSILKMGDDDSSQEDIEKHMCAQDRIKELKNSIESNGGLIDPLIVREEDHVVLEGNSRLAAYRLLARSNPAKWGLVKCRVIVGIREEDIFTLLGTYHIINRKDWDPFEKASYLFREKEHKGKATELIAKELGLTKQDVEKKIAVIRFMQEHNDLQKNHWSYYDEYLKNSALKKYRETNPNIDETIVQAIQAGQVSEAKEIRNLGAIAKIGDKQSKRIMQDFCNGDLDVSEAYQEAQKTGKLENASKRLKRFREGITEESFEKEVLQSAQTNKSIKFDIDKIIKRLQTIQKKIE